MSTDGSFGLAAKDASAKWVNAVSLNFGGTPKFVNSPWNSNHGLGTYGVDTATKTVCAVINHDGSFAAVPTASAWERARLGFESVSVFSRISRSILS